MDGSDRLLNEYLSQVRERAIAALVPNKEELFRLVNQSVKEGIKEHLSKMAPINEPPPRYSGGARQTMSTKEHRPRQARRLKIKYCSWCNSLCSHTAEVCSWKRRGVPTPICPFCLKYGHLGNDCRQKPLQETQRQQKYKSPSAKERDYCRMSAFNKKKQDIDNEKSGIAHSLKLTEVNHERLVPPQLNPPSAYFMHGPNLSNP